ncbi:hypothetical protein STEG23_014336, partial [Scotinomys teguina]
KFSAKGNGYIKLIDIRTVVSLSLSLTGLLGLCLVFGCGFLHLPPSVTGETSVMTVRVFTDLVVSAGEYFQYCEYQSVREKTLGRQQLSSSVFSDIVAFSNMTLSSSFGMQSGLGAAQLVARMGNIVESGITYDDINPGQTNSSLIPALGLPNIFKVLHNQLDQHTAVSVLNTEFFLNISMTFKKLYPPYPSMIHIFSQGAIILSSALTHTYCILSKMFKVMENSYKTDLQEVRTMTCCTNPEWSCNKNLEPTIEDFYK